MQQFIDKLISRLNDRMEHLDSRHKLLTDSGMFKDSDRIADRMLEVDGVKQIVNQLAEECKGGWVPVTERLPELKEGTECFKQSALCLVTEEWWDGDTSIAVGWYNQSGIWSNDSSSCKVIAWMPLPEPFQKDGE